MLFGDEILFVDLLIVFNVLKVDCCCMLFPIDLLDVDNNIWLLFLTIGFLLDINVVLLFLLLVNDILKLGIIYIIERYITF